MTRAGGTAMEESDLELISALQIAPRASWAEIGRVLGRHPTTLATRWERLRESGTAWVTAHLMGDPREMTVTLHDVLCRPDQRRNVVEALCRIPEIASVDECSRQKDIMLTVFSRSFEWLHAELTPQLDVIPGLVRHESYYLTELHYAAHDWRITQLNPWQTEQLRQLAIKPSADSVQLPSDFIDIARILARDGRASAAEISAATGVPPSTARRRLQRVLESGVLALRCDVAHSRVGYPLACQWQARLPIDKHRQVAQVLRQLGALRLCGSITGRANLVFAFWLRNQAQVVEIERGIAQLLPDLEIIESSMFNSSLKRMGWRLGPGGVATGEVVVPRSIWEGARISGR